MLESRGGAPPGTEIMIARAAIGFDDRRLRGIRRVRIPEAAKRSRVDVDAELTRRNAHAGNHRGSEGDVTVEQFHEPLDARDVHGTASGFEVKRAGAYGSAALLPQSCGDRSGATFCER